MTPMLPENVLAYPYGINVASSTYVWQHISQLGVVFWAGGAANTRQLGMASLTGKQEREQSSGNSKSSGGLFAVAICLPIVAATNCCVLTRSTAMASCHFYRSHLADPSATNALARLLTYSPLSSYAHSHPRILKRLILSQYGR